MIYLTESGAGYPIVLLHGTALGASHVRCIAGHLERHFRVLVTDLPGYGASPFQGTMDVMAVQESLLHALDQRGIKEFAAVGYSFGGHRALALAASQPGRVSAAVCLAGWANLSSEEREGYRQAARAAHAGIDLADSLAEGFFSPAFAQAHREAVAELKRTVQEMPRGLLAAEFEAVAGSPDLVEKLRTSSAQLFARVGSLDRSVAPHHCAEVPQAVLADVVPGAGHALLFEDLPGTLSFVERALRLATDAR